MSDIVTRMNRTAPWACPKCGAEAGTPCFVGASSGIGRYGRTVHRRARALPQMHIARWNARPAPSDEVAVSLALTSHELAALANRTSHVYNQLSEEARTLVRHLTATPDASAWFSAQDKILAATEALARRL